MLRRGYPLALPRRGLLAGGYEGVDRVIEFAGRLSGLSGGTHRIELHDVIGNADFGGLHTSLDYGRYDAQPLLGWLYNREGLQTAASYKFASVWSIDGSILFDMSRHYYDVPGQNTPLFYPTNYSVGLGYQDTCTTVKLTYSSTLSDPIASTPAVRDTTVLLQITLRTLGDIQASVGLGQQQ